MKMKNYYCIIDACSYIYLHQSMFNIGGEEHNLFTFFNQFVTIQYSKIVNDEITRNFDSLEEPLKRNERIHTFKKRGFKLDNYDSKLFGSKIHKSSEGKDSGEKANLAVSIDRFINDNKRGIIYLSDDLKAIDDHSEIFEVFKAFPYFPLWTSFEVILFLYLVGSKKGFDFGLAADAIKDLNSYIFNPQRRQLIEQKSKLSNDDYSRKMQELTEKMQLQETKYLKRLQIVQRFLN